MKRTIIVALLIVLSTLSYATKYKVIREYSIPPGYDKTASVEPYLDKPSAEFIYLEKGVCLIDKLQFDIHSYNDKNIVQDGDNVFISAYCVDFRGVNAKFTLGYNTPDDLYCFYIEYKDVSYLYFAKKVE